MVKKHQPFAEPWNAFGWGNWKRKVNNGQLVADDETGHPNTMSLLPCVADSQIMFASGACGCAGPGVPPPPPSSISRPRPSASQVTSCR